MLLAPVLFTPLLTSCGYNTPYHKPHVYVNNEWTVTDKYTNSRDAKNLPYLSWWRGFKDPTLNELIELGLKYNNNLNRSLGHIEAAQGELKKIKYQWIPNLELMLGYSRNPALGFPGVVGAIIPSYIINVFQQIKEVKKARYKLNQARAEDNAMKLAVISEISASYFTYLAEEERKRLLGILAKDLTSLAVIGEKMYKSGLTSNIDPQDLYSEVSLIHGEQELVGRNIIISRNAIRYLISQNPGPIKKKLKFININNRQLVPSALPLTVLENRPDMQIAENRLRATNEGISIAASHLLPTVQLDLIAGETAGNSRYAFPTEPIYFNDQLLHVPLFKFSVLGEVAKARGLNRVAYFEYIDTLQKALKDTTNALTEHDRFTNKLNHTIQAKRRLYRAYSLNRRLYRRGIQNYFEMLKTKVFVDKINIRLNQDKLQQLLTIVRLYQALAGGYCTP